jgi:hypothetical protein
MRTRIPFALWALLASFPVFAADKPTTRPVEIPIDGLQAIVSRMPREYLPVKRRENWTDAQKEGFAKWAKEKLAGKQFIGHVVFEDAVREKDHWKVTFVFPEDKVGDFTLRGTATGIFNERDLGEWGRLPRNSPTSVMSVITSVHAEPADGVFWIGIDLGECRLSGGK